MGDAALLAVLDDCGAVMDAMKELFGVLTGPLTRLQLRELMVRMAYCNILLEPRPRFRSELDLAGEEYTINVEVPDEFSLLDDPDPGLFGRLLYPAVGPILEALPNEVAPQTLAELKEGRLTFLLDDHGRFRSSSG
ncbi:MAG: hypothetical protein ABSD31_19500 [Candidatus Binataceae bacterium]